MTDDPARDPERLMREFRLGDDDTGAWRASGLPPEAFPDWLTDRIARRPAAGRVRCTGRPTHTTSPGGRSSPRWPSGRPITSWRWAAAAGCCCARRWPREPG